MGGGGLLVVIVLRRRRTRHARVSGKLPTIHPRERKERDRPDSPNGPPRIVSSASGVPDDGSDDVFCGNGGGIRRDATPGRGKTQDEGTVPVQPQSRVQPDTAYPIGVGRLQPLEDYLGERVDVFRPSERRRRRRRGG